MSNALLVLFSLVLIASLLLNLFNVLRPVSQTPQLHEVLQAQLTQSADRTSSAHGQLREELRGAMQTIHGQVSSNVRALGDGQRDQLSRMQQDLDRLTASTGQHLDRMTESNAQRLDGLRAMVETRLGAMQVDNGQHIESMRATVDEKLHGTLERKLSESFTQVSERLEQVQRGLGEMQSLASGVGDLKKVFSNVKTRGEWGEIQLAALLAQCLAPAQYEQNVSPQGNAERVEFVVKMPGHGETSDPIWLPIDAKFPLEDYRRLIDACEANDRDAEMSARAQLAARLRQCAKDINGKYVYPPRTTNFAILFLSSEGLFAEAMRHGLCDELQRKFRVTIAGPSTLWALLTSLQLGFQTLTIQKRTDEVARTLSVVKTEWGKYTTLFDKLKKKLSETSNTVDELERRNRAVSRALRSTDALPDAEASTIVTLDGAVDDDTAPEVARA